MMISSLLQVETQVSKLRTMIELIPEDAFDRITCEGDKCVQRSCLWTSKTYDTSHEDREIIGSLAQCPSSSDDAVLLKFRVVHQVPLEWTFMVHRRIGQQHEGLNASDLKEMICATLKLG